MLLLGIDLGTSYFKVGLFDAAGDMKGLGRVRVNPRSPEPGRHELAIDEFWRALREGLTDALGQAGARASDISGISYSSQATSFALFDAHDAPLTPLILWTDTRGDPVESVLQVFGRSEAFRKTIGYGGISGQSAVAKWRWFQRHAPDVWARAAHVMTISDYFTFALTGERSGDASTAAFLGVYDLRSGGWWKEALHALNIDAAKLSTPLRPGSPAGRTSARAAELIGLREGIPFAVGALDHHAAAIGSGVGELANVSISTGTVLAALVLVSRVDPIPHCYHGRHTELGRFYRLAFDPNGAGQLEAYQRTHAPQLEIATLLDHAAEPERHEHGRAVRTILERVATTHAGLVKTVLGPQPASAVVATGGGSRSPLWLQITANALRVPVVTPACPERACLGAAMFAAVATGVHSSHSAAAAAMIHGGRTYEPL